jgi:hypothetical protein
MAAAPLMWEDGTMSNKKVEKKTHRRAMRLTRKADKAQRKQARAQSDGLGQLVDSIQEHGKRVDVSQAVARIVGQTTEE